MAGLAATGVDAAAAGSAAVAAIDPTALSARITGMMARLIRMIPPWRLGRSEACCMPHQLVGAAELSVSYCKYLAYMHQIKLLSWLFKY